MSRRYQDGKPWLDWWPEDRNMKEYVQTRYAATNYGVKEYAINRLAEAGAVPAVKGPARNGRLVWWVRRKDLTELLKETGLRK